MLFAKYCPKPWLLDEGRDYAHAWVVNTSNVLIATRETIKLNSQFEMRVKN